MSSDTDFALVSDLTPGMYCTVSTTGGLGWLIRAVCRSPVDHAFVNLGFGLIAEAALSGVRIAALDDYKGRPLYANVKEATTAEQRREVCTAARGFTGRDYNYRDLLLILLYRLGVRWRWLRSALDDRDALICSELVCMAGQAAGLDWQAAEPDPAMVTPADLLNRPGMVRVMWG